MQPHDTREAVQIGHPDRVMAKGVVEALDVILAPLQLSVAQLKAKERYAEDIF